MKQSKLIKLLKGLTKEELLRFSKFVKSPFYNTNPTLVHFFEELKTAYPHFTASRIEKERIYKKLYPGKPFNYQMMSKLRLQLSDLVRDYLVVLENEEDQFLKQKTLVKAYGKRDMPVFYERGVMSLLKRIEKVPVMNVQYYYERLDLMYQYYTHPSTDKYAIDVSYFKTLLTSLDHYFVLYKLQLASESKSRELALSESSSILWMEEVMAYVDQLNDDEATMIKLRTYIYQLYQKEIKEGVFEKAYAQYQETLTSMKKNDQVVLFNHLINFVVKNINTGNLSFVERALGLYKFGLDNKLILVDGKLTEVTFNNIVSMSCSVGDFEWVTTFVSTYGKLLDEKVGDYIIALSLSEIDLHKREYAQVIDRLVQERFPVALYKMKSKYLMMQAYYELMQLEEVYFDLMLTQLDAFEKFLRRNKSIHAVRQKAMLNFVLALKYLVMKSFELSGSAQKKEQFYEKVKSTTPMFGKAWVLKKVAVV